MAGRPREPRHVPRPRRVPRSSRATPPASATTRQLLADHGKNATLVNIGGEGSPRCKLVEEKGNHEDNPTIQRAERWVTLPGDDKPGPTNIGDEDLSHMTTGSSACAAGNEDERDRRQGFLHSVACIMAAQSYWQGKRRPRRRPNRSRTAHQRPRPPGLTVHPGITEHGPDGSSSQNATPTADRQRNGSWLAVPDVPDHLHRSREHRDRGE